MIDMLVGPIYLRRFIQGRPMTATEIDDLATRVVAAFTPRLPPGSTAPGVARITGGSPATTLTPRTLRRIPRRCRPWRAATTTSAPSTSQFHDHYCGQTVAAKRPGQLSAAATSASSITGRGAHPVVAAAVAGDPGSDGDQAGPDGGAAGPGVEGGGEHAGGAGQVGGDGGQGEPGGVRREVPGGQVGERPVVPVGEDLLDDGVVAVVRLGLDRLERAVGEDGVVAPGTVEVADPADDQPGGDRAAFFFLANAV
jgi:hypothetical protein